MSQRASIFCSVDCITTSDCCNFKCIARKLRENNPLTALWVIDKVQTDFEKQSWCKAAEKIPWCIIVPLQRLSELDWEVAVVIRMTSQPNSVYLVLSTFSIVQEDLEIPSKCALTNFSVHDTLLETYVLSERLNMLKFFKCFFGDDPSRSFQKKIDDHCMRNFLSKQRNVIKKEMLPSHIGYIKCTADT